MMLCQISQQRQDFHMEILDGEAFLYHLSNTRILYCNKTAVLVWQLCNGMRSGKEIIAILQDIFPEASDRVKVDVEEALKQFVKHKALESLPASCQNS